MGFFKEKGFGPIAWCNRCHRKHARRDCKLVEGFYTSKAGNLIPCLRVAKDANNDN